MSSAISFQPFANGPSSAAPVAEMPPRTPLAAEPVSIARGRNLKKQLREPRGPR